MYLRNMRTRNRGPQLAEALPHVDCGAVCSAEKPHIELTAPNGQSVDRDACQFDQRGYRHRVTIPLMDGHYRVRAVEKSQAQGPYDV